MVTIFQQAANMFAYTEFVINGIYVWQKEYKQQEITEFPNGRKGDMVGLILEGEYAYEVGDERFTIPKGSLLFIPNQTIYRVRDKAVDDQHAKSIFLHFDTISPLPCPKKVYYREATPQIVELMQVILNIFQQTPVRQTRLREKVYRLFYLLGNDAIDVSTAVSPAIQFIEQHFCENHPVSDYAKLCLMSESYFRKKFKQHTGLSPLEYRNQLRLEEAKRLYMSRMPIHTIAETVGFEDPGYLTKIYKKMKGTSLREDTDLI